MRANQLRSSPLDIAKPHYPVDSSTLRAGDETDATPLLAVDMDSWVGGNNVFDAKLRGQQLTHSTTWNFGKVDERPTAVLSVATAEVRSHVQVALDAELHRQILDSILEEGRVAFAPRDVLDALPEEGLDQSLEKRVIIVDLRTDELESFLSTAP